MGFPMGFELILSCFVLILSCFMLILSYFWFGFVDFVFGLSNVEMGFVDCGGRLVIVGWCCVYSSTVRAEQREEMRGMRNRCEN